MTDEKKPAEMPAVANSLDELAAKGEIDKNGLPAFDKRLFQFLQHAVQSSSRGIALAPAEINGKPTSLIVGVIGKQGNLAETVPLYIRVTEEIYDMIRMPGGQPTAKSYDEAAKMPPTIELPLEDGGCQNPDCPVHGDAARVHDNQDKPTLH